MLTGYREKELLGDLKLGSHVAFNAIYDFYGKPVYAYLLQKLKDPDLCSDVLQDIFTNLWEKKATLEISVSLKAYLFQSARYKIFDEYRRDKKFERYLFELNDHINAKNALIEDVLDHRKQLADTMDTINKMPVRMKEIFILNRIDDEPIQEIATRLKLSKQTVKNQLGKALRVLRIHYSGFDVLILVLSVLFSKF